MERNLGDTFRDETRVIEERFRSIAFPGREGKVYPERFPE